jgi:hypothetical protein
MNKRVKKLWLKALRSGKYVQGQGTLRRGTKPHQKHCCLGVLSELAIADGAIKQFRGGYLSKAVCKWAGLESLDPILGPRSTSTTASELNDGGKSFECIAKRIEKYL